MMFGRRGGEDGNRVVERVSDPRLPTLPKSLDDEAAGEESIQQAAIKAEP